MNLEVNLDHKYMLKNKILLLFTNHRVAEKLWPIIPKLSETYDLDLFLIGLFSNETPWVGDVDEREVMVNKYKPYFKDIIMGPGVKYHGENITQDISQYIDLNKYSLVIFDDDREVPEFNIPKLYQSCKSKGIKVIVFAIGKIES